MFTNINDIEEFDKFIADLKKVKKDNTKDIDGLICSLNSLGEITFCNHALNRDIIIALMKDKNGNYEPFTFKLDYKTNKHLKILTDDYKLGFKKKKTFNEEMKAVVSVINVIKNLKINDTEMGLPHYYYNVIRDNKISVSFGWNLEKDVKKKKKTFL